MTQIKIEDAAGQTISKVTYTGHDLRIDFQGGAFAYLTGEEGCAICNTEPGGLKPFTGTGRVVESSPNLQTIPISTEAGEEIRRAFP